LKSGILGKRYAEAFFRAVETRLDTVLPQFRAFTDLVRQKPEIAKILDHPAINLSRKEHLLETACPLASAPEVAPFLRLLVHRRRFYLLSRIEKRLVYLYKKKNSIMTAQVTSALPLSADETQKLSASLSRRVGGSVEVENRVDPAIRGGLLIHLGDQVLDSTIRTRLKNLKEKMSFLTSHLLRNMDEAPVDLV